MRKEVGYGGHRNACFALEAQSLAEASAEGECCGGCSPPPAPPLVSPILIVEETCFTTAELCQDGEDMCRTSSEGTGDISFMRRHFATEIFPDPVEVILDPETTFNRLDLEHGRERLPSIVVELTEVNEVESGELRWPPENMDTEEEEEDLFLEQCIPPANIADWGEEDEEEEEEEETSVILNEHHGLTLIDSEIRRGIKIATKSCCQCGNQALSSQVHPSRSAKSTSAVTRV
ncbi:Protein LBH [Liparis tanakae]|uniref:Protein LBH n=1 Tax=Liparis tanakae TaxID=230148 RepID=A0A4Z2HVV9_9TELE|nr:Protein LBH [Liparis tanakae]